MSVKLFIVIIVFKRYPSTYCWCNVVVSFFATYKIKTKCYLKIRITTFNMLSMKDKTVAYV